MRTNTTLRRLLWLVLTAGLLSSTVAAVPVAAQSEEDIFDQAAADGPDHAVIGQSLTPLAPGGAAIAEGAILNSTVSPLQGPIQLLINGLPTGVSVRGLETTAGTDALVDWLCLPTNEGTLCSMVMAQDPTASASLGPETLAPWRLTLIATDSADLQDSFTITVSTSTGDLDTQIEPLELEFQTATSSDFPLHINADVPLEIVTNEGAVTTIEVINTSPDPLIPGSLTLTNLTPINANTVSTASDGWSCDSSSGDLACQLDVEVPTGQAAPPLVVDYTAPSTQAITTFTINATLTTSDGQTQTFQEQHDTTVIAGAPPQILVGAAFNDSFVVVPPATAELGIKLYALNLDHATGPAALSLTLPPGVTPTNQNPIPGWTCQTSGNVLTCDATDNTVFVPDDNGGVLAEVIIDLTIADNTEPGIAQIDIQADIGGEDLDALQDNQTTVDLVISEQEVPILEPVLYHADPDGLLVHKQDGSPIDLRAGAQFGVGAQNLGSAQLETGEPYSFELVLPTGITLAPDTRDTNWVCETVDLGSAPFLIGSRLECETTNTKPIHPDGFVEPLTINVTSVNRTPGAIQVPIAFTQNDPAAATNGTATVSIEAAATVTSPAPALSVSVEPIRLTNASTDTDSGNTNPDQSVVLDITNQGEGPTKAWNVLLDLPTGDGVLWLNPQNAQLRGVANAEVSCSPKVAVPQGLFADIASDRLLECVSDTPIEPGETLKLAVPVILAEGATTTELLAQPHPSELPLAEVTEAAALAVIVEQELDAVAQSLFDRITQDTDLVVLDGRDSTGAETHTWKQIPMPGEDTAAVIVEWDDGQIGGEQPGRLVKFVRPIVADAVTLRFELTVTQGDQTDTDQVTLEIEPTIGLNESDGAGPAAPGVASEAEFAPDAPVGSSVGSGIDPWAGFSSTVVLDSNAAMAWSPGSSHTIFDPYLLPYAVNGGIPAGIELSPYEPRYHDHPYTNPTTSRYQGLMYSDSAEIFSKPGDCPPGANCQAVQVPLGQSQYDSQPVLTIPASQARSQYGSQRYIRITWDLYDPSTSTKILSHVVTAPIVEGIPTYNPVAAAAVIPASESGQNLTVTPGLWTFSPSNFTYKIYSCSASSFDQSYCGSSTLLATLNSAGPVSYAPSTSLFGKAIRVVITAENSNGTWGGTWFDWAEQSVWGWPFANPIVETGTAGVSAPVAGSPTTIIPGTYLPSGSAITSQQWQVCSSTTSACTDIQGATNSTYTPTIAQVNKYLRAMVTVTNGADSVDFTTPARPINGPAPIAGVDPNIGISQTNNKLTVSVDPGTWSGVHSPETITTLYSCATAATPIANCTSIDLPNTQATPSNPALWTLTDATHIGQNLKATVAVTNWIGQPAAITASATSTATVVPDPTPTQDPGSLTAIIGSPQIGGELSIYPGVWFWGDDTGAPSAPLSSSNIQWQTCTSTTPSDCTNIAGATTSTYSPATSDNGNRIRATFTVANFWGQSNTAVTPISNPVAPYALTTTVAPNITIANGYATPHVGQTLTAVAATWNTLPSDPINTPTGYQWSRCANNTCSSISGSTASTYVVTTTDVGSTIKLIESVTTPSGNSASDTSIETNTVLTNLPTTPTPPQIIGTAQADQTLTLNPGPWTSWDNNAVTLTSTWHYCDTPNSPLASDTNTYTVVDADLGSTICATVTANSLHGTAPVVTTQPTANVIPRPAPTVTLPYANPNDTKLIVSTSQLIDLTVTASGQAPLSYSWAQTAGPALPASAFVDNTVTFTTPATGTGTYTFAFTVTQADGQQVNPILTVEYREGVIVTVAEGGIIDAIGNQAATLTASASGVGPFTYTWAQTSGQAITLATTNSATVGFTPPEFGDGSLTLDVTATDTFGASHTTQVTINYLQPVAINVLNQNLNVAGDVDVTVSAAASGVGQLSYTWTQVDDSANGQPFVPVDLLVNGSDVTVHTPATGGGALTLRVDITAAGNGQTTTHDFVINYAQDVAIAIPTPNNTGMLSAFGGVPLTIDSLPGGVDPFTYAWTQTAGPNVLTPDTATTNQALTINPPATGDGTLEFRVDLTAANGTSTALVQVDYIQPALITAIEPAAGTFFSRAATVTLAASATALDGVGTWTQTSGTPLLPNTGVIADTTDIVLPTTGEGTLGFTYQIIGSNGQTASQDIIITYGANFAPDGLCELINGVKTPGATVTLGDFITFNAGNGTVTPGGCDADLQASFQRSSLIVDGVFAITNASGTIDANGLRLTSGTMQVADAAFDGLQFALTGDGITLDFGGDNFAISGALQANGLAGVAPPAGWDATTTITFASGPQQTISIDASATQTGATTPATLSVGGSYQQGGAFTFTAAATGVLNLGGSDIALSGGISRPDRNSPITSTLGATISTPIQLGNGIELTTGSFAYTEGTVTGQATVTIGDLIIEGTLTASSANNWTLAISVTNDGSLNLAPGIILEGAAISGQLTRNGPAISGQLSLSADSWTPSSGVTVSNAFFQVSIDCQTRTTCTNTLAVAADVAVGLDGNQLSGHLSGEVNHTTGAMSLTATLNTADLIPGVTLTSSTLHIASTGKNAAGNSSTDIWIQIAGNIGGSAFDARLQVDDLGWWFSTEIDTMSIGPGVPTLRQVELLYSSTDRTVTLADDTTRDLTAATLSYGANMKAPVWVGDLTGSGRPDLSVQGEVNLATGRFNLTATLTSMEGTNLFDAGGVAVNIDSIYLTLTNQSGLVTGRIGGDVTLIIPGVGGGNQTVLPLTVEGGPSGDGRSFDASLSLRPGTTWNNAFGLNGLNISGLSIALQVGLGTGGGSIGIAGTASLPNSIADPLGITDGTQITLAARIGTGSSCFAFEIGDGTKEAIDLLNAGAITATQASLVIAPTGCRIGEYSYPPGMSFGFDGEVFDTPVFVEVSLDPTRGTLDAEIAIGRIALGGLVIEEVNLTAFVSPTTQEFTFDGAASLFGTRATIDGSFTRGPGGTDLALHGTFSGIDLDGFQIGEIEASFVTSNNMANIDIAASGSLDVLGTQIEAEFEFQLINGRLEYARGSGSLNTDLTVLQINAIADFEFRRGSFPNIGFEGELTANGFQLAAVSGRVNRHGATLLASLDLDPILSARVGGWIAFEHGTTNSSDTGPGSGALVAATRIPADAKPGDFELFADNVRIGVSGFQLNGRVRIGARDGAPTAELAAELRLGTGNDFSAMVSFEGELKANGDLDLAGRGDLRVAGQTLAGAQFALFVHPAAGEAGVSVDAQVNIGDSGIRVGGAFERRVGYGTLFRIYGTGNVSVGEFDLARTNLLLVRDAAPAGAGDLTVLRELAQTGPVAGSSLVDSACAVSRCEIRVGFVGAAKLQAPAVGSVEVTIAVSNTGGLAIDGTAKLEGVLGDALGQPLVSVGVTVRPNGHTEMRLRASVKDAFGIPVTVLFDATISSNGRLHALIEAQAHVGGGVSLGVAKFRASAQAEFRLELNIDLQNPSAINAGASISARASIQGKFWAFGWSGWKNILSVEVSGSTQPWSLRIRVRVAGFTARFNIS